MPGVFVSYRREETAGYAGRLHERLSEFFDEDYIVMDLPIPPREDFVVQIEQGVGSCDVLLVVIGRNWVTVTDANGERRLEDPQDFTRLEVEAALRREVRVIPVLVGGAKPPNGTDLPEALARLTRLQSQEVTDIRWESDTQKLVEAIKTVTQGSIPGPKREGGWQEPRGWQPPQAPAPRQPSPPSRPHIEPPGPEPSWRQAPPPEPYPPREPEPSPHERVKPFVTWGWITSTIGSFLIPFLALFGIVLGILVIARSDGTRTGAGIGIIVVAIVCGLLGFGFWAGVSGG
jgi:hypothetical protein